MSNFDSFTSGSSDDYGLFLILLLMAGTDVQFGGVPTERQLHCTLWLEFPDLPEVLEVIVFHPPFQEGTKPMINPEEEKTVNPAANQKIVFPLCFSPGRFFFQLISIVFVAPNTHTRTLAR